MSPKLKRKKNRNKVLHWELLLKAGQGWLQSTRPPATFLGKYCRRKMKPKKSLAVWFTTYLLYLLSITWNHSDNFEYWGIWHSLFAITRFCDIISPLLRWKKIIYYTKEFVIWRYVILRLYCILLLYAYMYDIIWTLRRGPTHNHISFLTRMKPRGY